MSELYELPIGWEWKKLGEIAKSTYGYTEKASNEEIGPKFLRITDIQANGVNWDTVPYCKITASDLDKYKLIEGDIVFARTGATTGKSYLIKNPPQSVFASYLIKVHIKYKELSAQFLYQYFQTNTYWDNINSGMNGSAQGGFNATKLSNLEIPLPPLSEQQRIVSKLDLLFEKIDKSIALHQKNIDEANAFMGSVLNDVFGELEEKYGLSLFKEIIENNIQNGLYKHKDFYNNIDTKILRIDNFYNGKINHNTIKRLSLDELELHKYSLSEGDIIINRVNSIEYLGKCAYVDKLIEPMVFESNMMRIKLIKTNHPLYIVNMLQSYSIKEQILKNAKRAINQCSINQTDVNGFKLPLPPLSIQQKVVSYLDDISKKTEKIKQIQKEKMQNLKALKASILDQAFRGEL